VNILGYRRSRLCEGVELYELALARIDPDRVIREWVASLSPEEAAHPPARFRLPAQKREARGVLVGDSAGELAEALCAHVQRTGVTELDRALALAPDRRRAAVVDVLRTFLEEPLSSRGLSLRNRMGRGLSRPVLSRQSMQEYLRTVDLRELVLGGGRWLFPAAGDVLELRADVMVPWRGHEVPRRERLVVVSSMGSIGGEKTLLCVDGVESRRLESLDEMPASLARALEAGGQAVKGGMRVVLPRRDLEPCALLRVPSRVEAEGVPRSEVPEAPLDATGLLAFDTLEPVPLPEAGPVIEDVRQAMAIAGRLRDGVFVRGDSLLFTAKTLGEGPRWMTLNRVGSEMWK